MLEEQKTWHEGVNSSIALKHESELIRLRAEIKQAEDLIRKSMRKSICCRRFTTE